MARSSARPWSGRPTRRRRPARSSRPVGVPDDPANVARRPFVKICGVTDAGSAIAAIAAGADAIGLNLVPGTPRALSLDEARSPATLIRAATTPATRGRGSCWSPRTPMARPRRASSRRSIPMSSSSAGEEPPDGRWRRRSTGLEGHPSARRAPADVRGRRRARSSPAAQALPRRRRRAPPARHGRRTASGRHRPARVGARWPRRSPGRCRSPWPAASWRRTSPRPCATSPRSGVDVASGVEYPRLPGERPAKDPYKVALFVKRARAARDDRPNLAFGPTPVHAGLLDADAPGRWGHGARLRRPVRARDADGRARAARERLRRPPRRPRVLGRAPRAAGAVRRSAHADLPRGPPGRRRPGGGGAAGRRPRPRVPRPAAVPQARGPRPHRARTRSTTRSARRS